MPLGLGIFLAAKRYGSGKQKKKVCLILDSAPYRYQQFISDIAGQDIQVHGNNVGGAIAVVRDWLRSSSGSKILPGGAEIFRRYQTFERELPTMCQGLRLERDKLTFNDLAAIAVNWLRDNVQ
jgi:hypothetical protein